MKKKLIILTVLALICTGCGNDKSDDQYMEDYAVSYSTESAAGMENGIQAGGGFEEDMNYDSEPEAAEEVKDDGGSALEENLSTKTGDAGKITKEMLVYRGELSIDTLDFTTSVNDFKNAVNEKGGFIETESYTDNKSTGGHYVIDKEDKHNMYYATIRIPSSEYDAFMNSASGFGDVRSKYSNATNVTQQYGTYKTQLEIYEAEYNRYLALLEEATEDEYALMIENQLFDIQIQIANLKSGITNIENDVAYSYIDITINEVSEYAPKPERTDTFFDRLKNTCKDSWERFLETLEDILFFIIMNIYGIVIIAAIIIIAIIIIRKKIRKNKGKISKTPVAGELVEKNIDDKQQELKQ